MQQVPLEIPEKLCVKAASLGENGTAWLSESPESVSELKRRWAITFGQSYQSVTESFVAEARTAEGEDVVLKIVIPGIDPARQELRTLRAAQGKGYAKLIRADEETNTMLLEKLGTQLHDLGFPPERQIEIICATLREAWTRLPEGGPFVTGAEKAAELASFIESNWCALGKPCSERAVELALAYAGRRQRAFDPAQSVLVHGDAHEWNTLCAPGSATGFKFVDPDGDLLDIGRQRCRLLAEFSGVEPKPIWEWGMIQCVSNGLLLKALGIDGPAAVQLAMADEWAVAGDGACS